jgi:hypothetical protein
MLRVSLSLEEPYQFRFRIQLIKRHVSTTENAVQIVFSYTNIRKNHPIMNKPQTTKKYKVSPQDIQTQLDKVIYELRKLNTIGTLRNKQQGSFGIESIGIIGANYDPKIHETPIVRSHLTTMASTLEIQFLRMKENELRISYNLPHIERPYKHRDIRIAHQIEMEHIHSLSKKNVKTKKNVPKTNKKSMREKRLERFAKLSLM